MNKKMKFLQIFFLFLVLICTENSLANQGDDTYPSIYLEADNLTYDESGTNISAMGNAKLFYKNYTIEANEITYNQDIDQVVAVGNITMSEKNNIRLKANKIILSNELKEGFIEGANMILQDGSKIRAKSGKINTSENIFQNAQYTFCEECIEDPDCPYTWEFLAEEVVHDQSNKKMVFKNIKFKLLDKTIFSLPRFSYPDFSVKRQSGFLLPSYTYSNFYGHGIKTPYLYVIDESSDITVSPFTTSRQGPLFDIEYRKKMMNGSEININPTFIYQTNPSNIAPGNEKFRASLKTDGAMIINDKFEWGWNGTFASDETYMRKYGLDARTKYNSNIYIEGINNKNYASLAAINYRNLLNEVETPQATLLPRFDHIYSIDLPYFDNITIQTNLVNTKREQDDEQLRITNEVSWHERYITNNGIVISPNLSLRNDWINSYDESDSENTKFNRFSSDISATIAWPFFDKTSYGKQIIEPKIALGFINKEKTSQDLLNEDSKTYNFNTLNLFENNKSLGFDRIDSGSRIMVGIDYFLDDLLGGNFEASIGKSLQIDDHATYFDEKWSGTNNYNSDIVGSINYNYNETVFVDYKTRYNEVDNKFDVNELNFEIKNPKKYSLGLNYTRIDADANWLNSNIADPQNHVGLNEISGLAEINLTNDWAIISSGTFNIETDKLLKSQIGLRFDDECLAFDIAYRENLFTDRDISKDRALLLNFELKTNKNY
jgi:LPS-assembly protein